MLNLRDLSDYQNGTYSTTAMTENGFDPYTHLLQQGLNLIGATDKFGNKLKEDGILGPKTQWAIDVGQTIGDMVGLNGHGTFTEIAENSNQFGSTTLNGEVPIPYYDSIKRLFPDLDIAREDFTRQISLSGTSANNHKMGKNDLRNIDNIMARQESEGTGAKPEYIDTANNENNKSVAPWVPITPEFTNIGGSRSAEIYNTIIDQFDVANAKRYKWESGNTYCNIFAWDVMTAMGVSLPHYINSDGITLGTRGVDGSTEMLINQTITWIRKYGDQYGWEKVTDEQAQIYANQGCPAITLYQNANGHGHVQVIRPSDQEYDPGLGAYIAQAGGTNFNEGYTSQIYSSEMRENVIEYYIHK